MDILDVSIVLKCEVENNMAIFLNETQYPISCAEISSVLSNREISDLVPNTSIRKNKKITCSNTLISEKTELAACVRLASSALLGWRLNSNPQFLFGR